RFGPLIAILGSDLDVVRAFLHRGPGQCVGGAEIAHDAKWATVRRRAELVDGSRPNVYSRSGPGDALTHEGRIVARGERNAAGQEAPVFEGFDSQPRRVALGASSRTGCAEPHGRLLCVSGLRRKTTARSARRPDAGAVPGRQGACLAVRTPPAALFRQ